MGFTKRESNDWEAVLADIDALVELCDTAIEDIGEPVVEYATSVRECALDIGDTIEANKHATSRQIKAIENQTAGIKKWFART